jgi:hypothetical protein
MQTEHQIIDFLGALAGAGKTYRLSRYAHDRVGRGGKFLFAQPSKLLIDNTVRDEFGRLSEIPLRAIHGDNCASPTASIIAHSERAGNRGEVLMISQQALLRLPYFERKQDWTLIVDEIPQVDQFVEFTLPENGERLFPLLKAECSDDSRYALVRPADETARKMLAAMAENKHSDDVWKVFQEFCERVISPHWDTWVLDSQFQEMRSGASDRQRLQAFSLLKPSIFEGYQRVIIAGACFEESLLYRFWQSQRVDFRPMANLPLRYDTHQGGDLITINYVSDEPWSKRFRNRAVDESENGETVLNHIGRCVEEVVGDQPFLWMGNNDLKDHFFRARGATRLPNSPHGLNEFQDRHTTVVLSALNPRSCQFTFLEEQGINGTAVRTNHYWSAVYQAVMRSSIRDPNCREPKRIIVMDSDTAHWLAKKFPGAKVEPLMGTALAVGKGKPGRPKLHASDADRKKSSRQKHELDLLIRQGVLNGDDVLAAQYPDLAAEVRALAGEGDAVARSGGTAFASIYESEPLDHIDYSDDDSFVEGLRALHRNRIEKKEDAGLISPAHFDSEMDDRTSRGLENIRHLRGIWLDNDGGDLTPEGFAALMARQRVVIWNTFSSTPERPRWRAFIPTTEAMSKEAHGLVLGEILHRVNKGGYWSPEDLTARSRITSRLTHGFDLSKLAASSLFYLPAQAAHPKGSFFRDFAGQDRDPLEPANFIKWAVRHGIGETKQRPVPVPSQAVLETCVGGSEKLRAIRAAIANTGLNQTRRDAAINGWRSVGQGSGESNRAFYRLAVGLKRAGLNDADLRATLHDEAIYARYPADRRRDIPRIVRGLRKAHGGGSRTAEPKRWPTNVA